MRRYEDVTGYLLAAGALAWLAKLVVIVATDGRVTDTGAAAVFYLVGLALLVLGAPGIGLRLTPGRPVALRLLAGLAALVAFVVVGMGAGDAIGGALGGSVPAYAADEAGIALSVLMAAAAAAWLLRTRPATHPAGGPGTAATA